jgi:signal transduction histidine kinase
VPIPRRFIDDLRRPRSLGAQLVLIMTLVGIAGAIGITVLLAGIITPSFEQLKSAPGNVAMLGRRVLLTAIGGSTLLLLLVLVALRRIIAHLVLGPIDRLRGHMQRVRTSGMLLPLDDDDRRDEIGSLGKSFNAMLSQLDRQREQIEAQSFLLGRSESAIEVMHNVRNALNPLSTILTHGTARSPLANQPSLDRALAELAQADVPPDRREKLAAFIHACLASMESARAEQVRQLDTGREALAQVLEIIGEQQAHTHRQMDVAPCDITDIIARNATIARYVGGASIVFAFPAEPVLVLANRLILSQVVGNLFSNAAEAIAATGRQSGSITVTTTKLDDVVRVRICDDGEGFAPDDASLLFQRGFSSRTDKAGGLGLHWCANSMIAMRGSLQLGSEGRGRGAVAELTLPTPEGAGSTQSVPD